MADLVEYVIDGILQREKMQQRAKQQPSAKGGEIFSAKLSQSLQVNNSAASQAPSALKERDEALWKVSRQFEAVFVQQMMTEMRKTVGKSDFMPSGYAEDVHASMMDEAIAQASTKRGSFGIADSIYRQLESAQKGTSNGVEQQQEALSIQEISNAADNLEMSSALAMEVKKHAH